MKLYEINEEIRRLLWLLEPDPETGEVPLNEDELLEQLNSLQIERANLLTYLAKVILNLRSEAEMVKAEEVRLKERRQAIERREELIMAVLDRECNGENADFGIAVLRYRASTRAKIIS